MRTLFLTAVGLISSTALFAQSGSGVEIEQTGQNNVAEIEQQNLSPAVSEDLRPVFNLQQDGSDNHFSAKRRTVENSLVNARQEGNSNKVEMEIYDVYSETHITQIGEENVLWMSSSPDFSTIRIEQGVNWANPGVGNQATVQSGGIENWLYISQIGQENTADIYQTNFSNSSSQIQNGSFNQSSIHQAGPYHSFENVQEGVGNKVVASQNGEGVMTKIEQFGNGNEAFLTLSGGLFANAFLEQNGTENQLELNQTILDGEFEASQSGIRNSLVADQFGIDVEARIQQDGENNSANLELHSDGGFLNARQFGNANEIDVLQTATFSRAEIMQNGNGSSATIIQD